VLDFSSLEPEPEKSDEPPVNETGSERSARLNDEIKRMDALQTETDEPTEEIKLTIPEGEKVTILEQGKEIIIPDLEALCEAVIAAGLSTGHADDVEGLIEELIIQAKEGVAKRGVPSRPEPTQPTVTMESIEARIEGVQVISHPPTSTIVVITMNNGFDVVGHSACVHPDNYDAEVGERIAYDNAFRQLWPLEGYLLAEQLIAGRQPE